MLIKNINNFLNYFPKENDHKYNKVQGRHFMEADIFIAIKPQKIVENTFDKKKKQTAFDNNKKQKRCNSQERLVLNISK